MKYTYKDKTYFAKPKDNPKDLIEVEIGDSKQPDIFIPQQKIMRWDNECNVSIRLIEDKDEEKETATIIEENGKIKHIKSKRECHFYNLGVSAEHPEDASEFEIILKEDPRKNKTGDYNIEFSIEDKDVDYFYQPALTPAEIGEGANRPENVEGSYAIYAKTPKTNWKGGKEYKCGKIGHIYRPKIIDSAGTEVWGELKIDKGILTVTIPQDFLDKAVYPVRHAAGLTFGYDTAGGTKSNKQNTTTNPVGLLKNSLTATTGDTVTMLSISAAKDVANITIGMAVYTQVSSLPSSYVTNSGANTPTIDSTSQAWYNSNINVSLNNGTIYNVAFGNRSGDCYIWFDTGTGEERSADDASDGQMPLSWNNLGTSATKYSIYATYTAGGGTVQPNHLMSLMGCGC